MTELNPDRIRAAIDAVPSRAGKVDVMVSYVDRLLPVDASRATELAAEALHIATLGQDSTGMAHCYRRVALGLARQGRHGDAVLQARKALPLLEQIGDTVALAGGTSELAGFYAALGDHNRALAEYEHALALFEQSGDNFGRATTLEALGAFYCDMGDYRRALEYYLQALDVRQSIGDAEATGLCTSHIGVVYGLLGEAHRSLEFLHSALAMFQGCGNRLLEVRTLVNAGRAHYALGELEPALELAFKALAIYEELGDRASIPAVLGDIGSIYERRGELEPALNFHRKALALLEGQEPDVVQLRLFLSVANLYQQAGLDADAVGIATQALRIAEEIGERQMEYQLHRTLAAAHESQNETARALEHFKRYSEIRDEVQGIEMQRAIAEMQLRFDVERTAREKEIYRLRAEQLELDMEHKRRELTAMALNMIQKNTLLENVTEQVKLLTKTPGDESRRVARGVLNQLSESRQSDEAWKEFESQLTHLQGDFVRILSERFPSLSTTEVRICSLLKINLSTKEIAEMMGTSVRTIENHRYRIKKKIDPDSERTLVSFLATI